MKFVLVSPPTAVTCTSPRGVHLGPSRSLVCCHRLRRHLHGTSCLRRLITVSKRQELDTALTVKDKQYSTSNFGSSRHSRVRWIPPSHVSSENKNNLTYGPGYLGCTQLNYEEASKAASTNNAYLWREAGERYHRRRQEAYKYLQKIPDGSLHIRGDKVLDSYERSPVIENSLEAPFTPSRTHDVPIANADILSKHGLTFPEFCYSSNETKTLERTTQEDPPIEFLEEKYHGPNGSTNKARSKMAKPHVIETSIRQDCLEGPYNQCGQKKKVDFSDIYPRVLVVNTIAVARETVHLLRTKYKDVVHACDTEVAKIDVKQETPVDHGELICFSIYSGPEADFGDGKSYIWVDVLDGEKNIMLEFAPFFEDDKIRKVWHNYSFDYHVIRNCGINISGLHADTMHLARLWDSSRRMNGGYSLEALTSDSTLMSLEHSLQKFGSRLKTCGSDPFIGKISMKDIFGKKKLKKDGTEGKIITVSPVEELQRGERQNWICYSVRDSFNTYVLFESLTEKLAKMPWVFSGTTQGTMLDFYKTYWKPFGVLLVEMEAAGILVDRDYLSEIEKVAISEQQVAAERFRRWAMKYCSDAKYMNVGSDTQLRQLFFGGISNIKDPSESLPISRKFKVPNIYNIIEEGKSSPSKNISITIHKIGDAMSAESFTPSGWPSVGADALRIFSGKVSANHIILHDDDSLADVGILEEVSLSKDVAIEELDGYGTAYVAFGKGREGMDACHAIAALCEICSIDSLISNFILPLQGNSISGKEGRIHCSLNINTETGRLSARRPNLQNPPALEKDRYKIRQAFVAAPGNTLIVADYGQLELRILAHLANCKSMLDAFKCGGDFHSRTAMNMYPYIREAVDSKKVLLEWHPLSGEDEPPVPLLKDAFSTERRKAKMLNFSIAYGKTPLGLSKDWKVSVREAKETVRLWYNGRQEVLKWQQARKREAVEKQCVYTLLGRARRFPSVAKLSNSQRGHIERAAINTPVQGSAADVAMCAMLEIARNHRLKELKWKLLLQVHDEVILEGPCESAEEAKAIVVECMSKPFDGRNILNVDLAVDAKCAQNWYAAK